MIDYREVLRAELKKRKELSPKYSLRDFAKSLGLVPSHLSYLLRDKRGLSKESATRIAASLRLTGSTGQRFCRLASLISGRSKVERNLAKQALQRKPLKDSEILLDHFCDSIFSWKEQAVIFSSRVPHVEFQRITYRAAACGLNWT